MKLVKFELTFLKTNYFSFKVGVRDTKNVVRTLFCNVLNRTMVPFTSGRMKDINDCASVYEIYKEIM